MRISDWSSDVCSSDLLAVGRGLLFVACRLGGVLAYRCDAVVRAGLVLVSLALEDDFAVAGLEVEIGLAVLAGKHGELAAHQLDLLGHGQDRKSTRLNSSH